MSTHAASHPAVNRRPAGEHAAAALVRVSLDHQLLLPLGALIALAWANVWPDSYFSMSRVLAFPVSEIGMAFFFAVITQELVEETMAGGALHGWRRWTLPIIAAAGGVAGAAIVYFAYVGLKWELMLRSGWPVAATVDVAFAYMVVRAIFRRHPAVAFLLLLAIATTAMGLAVSVIRDHAAVFRSGGTALIAAAVGLAALLRHRRIRIVWPYIVLCGPLSWMGFYVDGVHPALALVPIVPFLPHAPRGLDLFHEAPRGRHNSSSHIEHAWRQPVEGILFLFGLVTAGVVLQGHGTGTWATLAAALGGRTAGILLAVALAGAAGLRLAPHLKWRELTVVALAASCGLTFALFVASALYPAGPLLSELKFGALLTALGIPIAFGAARLLHVGRFKCA